MKNRARSSSRSWRRWASRVITGLTAAYWGVFPIGVAAQDIAPTATPEAGYAWVIFGADTVVAEVAGSGSDRSRGLQNRDVLPAGTGMLFTFDSHDKRTFWMKDTLIDLDLAVFDEGLRVTEILALKAESLELRDTETVVFMALEVPGGWFALNGIEVGSEAIVVLGADPDS